MKHPDLLEAFLIFQQLLVLVEFQAMLLEEAVKRRLHVSELSEKPAKNKKTFRSGRKKNLDEVTCWGRRPGDDSPTSAPSPSPYGRPTGPRPPSLRSPDLREGGGPPSTPT